MKSKKKILIILVIVPILILLFYYSGKIGRKTVVENDRPIRIAICSTYYEAGEKLDPEKFEVIKTDSTAEGIYLLTKLEVDLVLADRNLKPSEPNYSREVIGGGYSFLSGEETTILETDLVNYEVYTDLAFDEIRDIFPLGTILKAEDVYEHLDDGIIITSWENTDYFGASIVNLLNENGEINKNSRRPTIYCSSECNKEISVLIKSALE